MKTNHYYSHQIPNHMIEGLQVHFVVGKNGQILCDPYLLLLDYVYIASKSREVNEDIFLDEHGRYYCRLAWLKTLPQDHVRKRFVPVLDGIAKDALIYPVSQIRLTKVDFREEFIPIFLPASELNKEGI